MNKRVVGALILLLLGAAGIFGVWYLLPRYREVEQVATSDAQRVKGKISIALDNWIGYFVLRSPEFEQQMRRAGWQVVIKDDSADYGGRMKRLKDGELEFAVATVDSYILNGAGLGFPGTIIMVIDQSKGGDAILARQDKIPSLDAVRGVTDIRVAFTPLSPSHHLLKAASYHFSLPELLPEPGNRRIETKGSQEALNRFLSGAADVAVLWEPDVARALSQPGVVKILGTEDTEKLIVDVLLVNRKFSKKSPEVVSLLLSNYFRALKKYQDNRDLLRSQVVAETGLPEKTVETMLKGVKWVNLTENCEQWFGISPPGGRATEGLKAALEATVRILVSSGDFPGDPLPDGDPYRLIYSAFLEQLFVKDVTGFKTPVGTGQKAVDALQARFSILPEEGWLRLKEVGTLKVDPIIFQSGATELDLMAKEIIDRAAELLSHYPNFRLVVKGHTGTRGDPAENQRLSQERADAVGRYLTVVHGVDPNRLRAIGFGGSAPLKELPGESQRSYQYRLPRVELVLVREEY